jgi:hypothetical protein
MGGDSYAVMPMSRSTMAHSLKGSLQMRKMIFMAIATFLWKKFQANKAAKTTGRSSYRP